MQSSWTSYKQSIISSTYLFDGIDKMVCLCKYWYALLRSISIVKQPVELLYILCDCFYYPVGAKADGGNRPPVTRPNYGCQVTVQVSVVTMNR